jgi:O-antigen/teichoic acid export membrane protein
LSTRLHRLRDLAFACGLLLLLLVFFWPVTIGDKTLLPADALYQWQPWRAHAPGAGAIVPHNRLVTDLILQNYVWKQFVLECLQERQLPLWNPYILSGQPFLAAGQHSALYPFSIVHYLLPLGRSYGVFIVLQLLVAGLSLYYYARTIRLSRFAATAGGLVYAFSGFMLVSTVFPMIIAAAAWLPFLLAMVERLALASRADEATLWRERLRAPLPWLVLGSVALGLQSLAGHVEISYYSLLVLGVYAVWRAVGEFVRRRRWPLLLLFGGNLGAMLALGLGLGAVQLVPLYEFVTQSFREGSATYQQIVGWAYPPRHLLAFLIPDFFGNPVHHSYIDLFTGQAMPALSEAEGQPVVWWGIKNYVEGGAYVSLLALFLGFIGAIRRPRSQAWFFITLGLFSLSLVFGLPTYRLIFHLPGINQLHSPFRWVFPYTVCMAVLAAMGTEELATAAQERRRLRLPVGLGALAMLGGLGALACVAVARAFPQWILPLADRAVARLALASAAFSGGRMFVSYQARNLLLFGLCLLGAGAILLWPRLRRPGQRLSRTPWPYLLLAVLFLDPTAWLRSFQPAVDAAPLQLWPVVVDFLHEDTEPFRITVYDTRSTKPLPPNTSMYFGLQDVRGYDSIITRQYAEVMALLGPQELQYNQIARLKREESLGSPILDLLNVRYVLTEETIDRPDYTLVHEGELRVYRNDTAMPRAFVTFQAQVFADRESLLEALPQADPRQAVFLEQTPAGWANPAALPPAPAVQFREYSPDQVRLHVDMPAAGFLVLGDNYFPGWVAYTQPAGEHEEQALTILRANGTVRAVQLPAGPQTVRFKYSPLSFKIGLFISFTAAVSLLLLGGLWLWSRVYSPMADERTARRVAKNTALPLSLQLVNRGIDMAFMMLALRILGPDNAGRYYFAVFVATLFEIVTNFGLNTLLTREVARNQEDGNRFLWNSSVLRLGLFALGVPLLGAFLLLYRPMPGDTALAIVLLAVGLVPSSLSAGLSAMFMAFEVMVIPAVVSTVTTLCKVTLGTAALLLGWGFVGLAGTSVVVNLITMGILLALVVTLFFRPHPQSEPSLRRRLVGEAYPLMVNHLLAMLFFKVDVILLQRLWGDAVLGWYSVSYKLVDAVGIIPPTFTMAIFPLMSRFASASRESLLKSYVLSIKLLLSVALLIALLSTALAYPLAGLMGGAAFLPHSAIALELIVWYMPLGFINSVTQYVLIALNQQRFLTKAFAAGLGCGLAANLLVIPRFGYRGAAAVHIFSELALLVAFYVGIRRYLAPVPWLRVVWRPVVAAALAAAALGLLRALPRLPVAALMGAVYLALLLALGAFDATDRALLGHVIPLDRVWLRLRQRFPARTV